MVGLMMVLAGVCVGSPPAFTDVTVESGVSLIYACSEAGGSMLLQMGGGGVVADFDGDGWQDLFAVAGGSGPDRLYMNNGDGTFTDEAAAWGVAVEHAGTGACAGDYDGDGDIDLFVTSLGEVGGEEPGHHKLYRNEGGVFVDVAASAGVAQSSPEEADGFGSCFGDWDLDGDLDLVVCGWADSFDGTRLFENEGDGTFADVTAAETNLDVINVFGFSPRLMDMDGDRWPELLLVADFETSRYYRNNGVELEAGRFTDVTETADVSHETNGMGQTVGDVNNDGLLDWYVTSIFSGDGSGNFLYMNQGGHHFEANKDAGVTDGGWGWGTTAVDVNQDGWLDLVETNGWPSGFAVEQAYLFMNDGDGETFTEMAIESGLVHMGQGRGIASFDYDNDGDMDIAIFTYCGALRLFRNDVSGAGSLRVMLDTSAEAGLAPEGRGSVVRATTDGFTQMRVMDGGSNFVAHGEMSAHFGIGDAPAVDKLQVEWANGRETVLTDVGAGQVVVAYCPGDFNGDGALNVLDFVAFQIAFQGGEVSADCDGSGELNVLDFVCFQLDFGGGCG